MSDYTNCGASSVLAPIERVTIEQCIDNTRLEMKLYDVREKENEISKKVKRNERVKTSEFLIFNETRAKRGWST